MTTQARHLNLTVVLGALLASACAAVPATRLLPPLPAPLPATYAFTIGFDTNGCPKSATPSQANCPDKRPDCLAAKRGETVQIVGNPATTGFFLQFDPFKGGIFRPSPGALKVDVQGAGGKTFTFNVLSDPPDKCPPLDPIIIIN